MLMVKKVELLKNRAIVFVVICMIGGRGLVSDSCVRTSILLKVHLVTEVQCLRANIESIANSKHLGNGGRIVVGKVPCL